MDAYHGCAVWNAVGLVTAIETRQPHLKGLKFDATDTAARATRYANAQATGEVDLSLTQNLATYGAVIELDVPEREWFSRGEHYAGTLDAVERPFSITEARVVRVTVKPVDAGRNDSTHRDVAQLRALLGDRLVLLAP
ncbi:hypothetical protein GCM10008959_31650 [Deinococcus seoulensis]|uniref:Uncharacterized protein n=1 Tax=Deinococcus seoulensis TaxID=1837379 RepID=A0ABQ2RW29_9DEIO|nr:hypothetical protein [Deinococcus seoulensis]GGR67142.1 hypothetical protein GCM10008959_31650 [Deinococcus seoulensis]